MNLSKIVELWSIGSIPAVDGLYRSDGSARVVEVDDARLTWFRLGRPLDVSDLLASDPDNVIEIDLCAEVEIPNGRGFLCCGEGALGSYGFFARLGADRALTWVVALTRSNPFMQITMKGSRACFINNLGNSVIIDLEDPDFE